jgi:hypothetical protein
MTHVLVFMRIHFKWAVTVFIYVVSFIVVSRPLKATLRNNKAYVPDYTHHALLTGQRSRVEVNAHSQDCLFIARRHSW